MTFKNTKSDAEPVCRKAWWHLFKTDQFQMQTMIWPGLILCFIFCYIPMYGGTHLPRLSAPEENGCVY